jgi:membrane protease subunit HflC
LRRWQVPEARGRAAKIMQHGDTHLVLRPDSDFFRYFGDPSGKPPPSGVEAATAPKSLDVQAPAAPKPSASK